MNVEIDPALESLWSKHCKVTENIIALNAKLSSANSTEDRKCYVFHLRKAEAALGRIQYEIQSRIASSVN